MCKAFTTRGVVEGYCIRFLFFFLSLSFSRLVSNLPCTRYQFVSLSHTQIHTVSEERSLTATNTHLSVVPSTRYGQPGTQTHTAGDTHTHIYIYTHAGPYVSLDTVFVLFIVRCTSHFFCPFHFIVTCGSPPPRSHKYIYIYICVCIYIYTCVISIRLSLLIFLSCSPLHVSLSLFSPTRAPMCTHTSPNSSEARIHTHTYIYIRGAHVYRSSTPIRACMTYLVLFQHTHSIVVASAFRQRS